MPIPTDENLRSIKAAYNSVSRAVEEMADFALQDMYSEHYEESERIFRLLLDAQTSLANLMAGKPPQEKPK
jgi:hypothetical protein